LVEPDGKQTLSAGVRQAVTEHWLGFVTSRGFACRRSLNTSVADDSYQSEIRALNRFRAPRASRFEFREIAGEFVRFDHVAGEVAIKIGNSYLRPGDIPPSRSGEINRIVFLVIENYLRSWRPV
jgi:hypothetical protein